MSWLSKQKKRQDDVGKFARDATVEQHQTLQNIGTKPRVSKNKELAKKRWNDYFDLRGGDDNYRQGMEQSIDEYFALTQK
jgi:hypothetical protein